MTTARRWGVVWPLFTLIHRCYFWDPLAELWSLLCSTSAACWLIRVLENSPPPSSSASSAFELQYFCFTKCFLANDVNQWVHVQPCDSWFYTKNTIRPKNYKETKSDVPVFTSQRRLNSLVLGSAVETCGCSPFPLLAVLDATDIYIICIKIIISLNICLCYCCKWQSQLPSWQSRKENGKKIATELTTVMTRHKVGLLMCFHRVEQDKGFLLFFKDNKASVTARWCDLKNRE